MEEKQKKLVKALMREFNEDSKDVKRFAEECKFLGFPLNSETNIDLIAKYPEHFIRLISLSSLGVTGAIISSVNKLKEA